MLTSQQVRAKFLDFFKQKGHHIVASAPIVLKNDPTLLFTNSGMVQFKDYFLGNREPEHRRVADTQKCLRASGKHNDLEDVGHDTYHHTMFEMLGNWSFGDYFKAEAIAWSWELLTREYGLPADRLYATVFEGDPGENLPPDEEALRLWKQFLPDDHILYGNKKDNFWEMGATGPCGPCSEIHIDMRSDEERAKVPGHTLVNKDNPLVVEVWNNVFMQFNRKADNSLEPLPARHVDTGMGFERLLMVIQGKTATYDTDLFTPIRQWLERRTGLDYVTAEHKVQVAMRVVMDHIRAITFTIADGQIPSNTGAGYVVRRILRRASRYAFAHLNLSEPFLYQLVDVLIEVYDGVFPEIAAQRDFLRRIIEEEERNFLDKLERGSRMFDEYLREHRGATRIDGEFAFKLYDTYGFPIDLTQLMARERGCTVDTEGFDVQLGEQKKRSRAATEVKTGDWVYVYPSEELPRFLGYDTLSLDTRILRYRTLEQKDKKIYQVVLEETPFYAESGGQVGDKGTLRCGEQHLQVLDTRKENELIVHFVDQLPQDAEGEWRASVDEQYRRRVMANHSATHLMHAALRQVLGTHVEQRGSLVAEDVLRFDFSHFAKVTDEELAQVSDIVNEKIAAAIPLQELREMPIEAAKAMGAMALFGEKYGDRVRVIVFDPGFSVELCGGTHVKNSSEVRLFKFVSESSSAAGIRRVEALTGDFALAAYQEQETQLGQIQELLKAAHNPVQALEQLLQQQKNLEKQLEAVRQKELAQLRQELPARAETLGGVTVLRQLVAVDSAESLRQLAFDLRQVMGRALIVLGAEVEGKALLAVILSEQLAGEGKLHAGNLVRELAKSVQGGGGGQPFFATAGGKDPAGLPQAIARVAELVGA